MIFKKRNKVYEEYKDYNIFYFLDATDNYYDKEKYIGCTSRDVEDNVIKKLEKEWAFWAAEIWIDEKKSIMGEPHLMIVKENISFDLVEFAAAEYITKELIAESKLFYDNENNYTIEFLGKVIEQRPFYSNEFEIYANSIDKCIGIAKKKLQQEYSLEIANIYKLKNDYDKISLEGILEKIIKKTNVRYALAHYNATEWAIVKIIFDNFKYEKKDTKKAVTIMRDVEEYNQKYIRRYVGEVKEILKTDNPNYNSIIFGNVAELGNKSCLIKSEMVNCLERDLLKLRRRSIKFWLDENKVIYHYFPYE